MALDPAALQQRLLQSFRIEARERLDTLDDGLATWREGESGPAEIDALFREIHSLKGAARAVGLEQVERICHAWESLFEAIRSEAVALTPAYVALSRGVIDQLRRLNSEEPVAEAETGALVAALEAAARGETVDLAAEPPPAPAAPAAPGLLRVAADNLNALLVHGETLLQLRLEMELLERQSRDHAAAYASRRQGQRLDDGELRRLREVASPLLPAQEAALLNRLLDQVDLGRAQSSRLHSDAVAMAKRCRALAYGLAQLGDAYAADLEAVLLLPASNLVEGVPAMLQDLAGRAGKQVDLTITGAELQIDKRILDELRTPLTHLLRNAVDHGLESPDQRALFGKPARGQIRVDLVQETADRFQLVVADDGRGIDVVQLKARAQQAGLLDEAEAAELTEAEAFRLVFAPGLSTSTMITELSGRGLGMPIILESIENIGGRVEIDSTPGQGTRFHLDLPLSLSTFRAVIVRNAERLFAVPARAVERCVRVAAAAIRTLENRPSLVWEGAVLPVWPLADVLGLPRFAAEGPEATLLLLEVRGHRFALLVDELIDDQEVNVKSLGMQLQRVRNLLGATLLGNGQLVPILHPGDLYASALATTGSSLARRAEDGAAERPRRLLIAEDSFTSRGLLKAILEDAGYRVTTVNDGLDAWNALKQEAFDLLVTDVEMPRMDGFALTSRLRADPELAELPVILVTALESSEDRARGLEAGANAYLAKSGFGRDSLLDAIRRLI